MNERPAPRPESGIDGLDPAQHNRSVWNRWSDGYQEKHGEMLRGAHAAAWGLWRIPESQLDVLGDVAGQRVLELGCGAAHWSAELVRRGAFVIGLDSSSVQLRHAAKANPPGQGAHLVQGCAEHLPFADSSFDLVFSDYGAMSWADPAETLPEVSRVLRSGGALAFCTASPFFVLFLDDDGALQPHPQRGYFDLFQRLVSGAGIDYQLPYSQWIALFTRSGLVVDRLVEPIPPDGAFTTFRQRPVSWAKRWPMETIWRLVKR